MKSATSMNWARPALLLLQHKCCISKLAYKKGALCFKKLNLLGCLWKGVPANRNPHIIKSTVSHTSHLRTKEQNHTTATSPYSEA